MQGLTLMLADKDGQRWAQQRVTEHHYLHGPPDPRCRFITYLALLDDERVGVLMFGRPEATKVLGWYGSLAECEAGRYSISYWNVINLARVWLDPRVQVGGEWCTPERLPVGFQDRKGMWRPALASTLIEQALERVVYDYLVVHPPVWCEQPYDLKECLSYCNTRLHRGVIYRASHFTLHRENAEGIQTYRRELRVLTGAERVHIEQLSAHDPRAQRLRAQRKAAETIAQPALFAGL